MSTTPFDGECQNIQTLFFIFFFKFFAKVRAVRTKVRDAQTDRHTETDKSSAISEILSIFLKIRAAAWLVFGVDQRMVAAIVVRGHTKNSIKITYYLFLFVF